MQTNNAVYKSLWYRSYNLSPFLGEVTRLQLFIIQSKDIQPYNNSWPTSYVTLVSQTYLYFKCVLNSVYKQHLVNRSCGTKNWNYLIDSTSVSNKKWLKCGLLGFLATTASLSVSFGSSSARNGTTFSWRVENDLMMVFMTYSFSSEPGWSKRENRPVNNSAAIGDRSSLVTLETGNNVMSLHITSKLEQRK